EEALTRLGEGVQETRVLRREAIERTAEAVAQFVSRCREYGAEQVVVAATSAARDAGNFESLNESIRRRTGLSVRLLSGEEEARAAFRGARAGHPEIEGSCLVIDVGGGSTELVTGNRQPQRWLSLNIGSVRLKERFLRGDPFRADEWKWLCHYVRDNLERARTQLEAAVDIAIGVGGTITTLAMLEAGLDQYDAARIHGMELTTSVIETWASRLARMTYEERTQLPGVPALRGDVLPVGAQIFAEALRVFDLRSLVVSTFGIRHGILLE
ncbi:MAG: Ppx/GppA family phosphatase, partial [candidate division KSB1 bacterium]|nr:Ppx/GppA family phosphatase [candidate division KSB1 bacterium]